MVELILVFKDGKSEKVICPSLSEAVERASSTANLACYRAFEVSSRKRKSKKKYERYERKEKEDEEQV